MKKDEEMEMSNVEKARSQLAFLFTFFFASFVEFVILDYYVLFFISFNKVSAGLSRLF